MIWAYTGAGTCLVYLLLLPFPPDSSPTVFFSLQLLLWPCQAPKHPHQSPAGTHLKAFLLRASRSPTPTALALGQEHRATKQSQESSGEKSAPAAGGRLPSPSFPRWAPQALACGTPFPSCTSCAWGHPGDTESAGAALLSLLVQMDGKPECRDFQRLCRNSESGEGWRKGGVAGWARQPGLSFVCSQKATI